MSKIKRNYLIPIRMVPFSVLLWFFCTMFIAMLGRTTSTTFRAWPRFELAAVTAFILTGFLSLKLCARKRTKLYGDASVHDSSSSFWLIPLLGSALVFTIAKTYDFEIFEATYRTLIYPEGFPLFKILELLTEDTIIRDLIKISICMIVTLEIGYDRIIQTVPQDTEEDIETKQHTLKPGEEACPACAFPVSSTAEICQECGLHLSGNPEHG